MQQSMFPPRHKIGDIVRVGDKVGKVKQFSTDDKRVEVTYQSADGDYHRWHDMSELPKAQFKVGERINHVDGREAVIVTVDADKYRVRNDQGEETHWQKSQVAGLVEAKNDEQGDTPADDMPANEKPSDVTTSDDGPDTDTPADDTSLDNGDDSAVDEIEELKRQLQAERELNAELVDRVASMQTRLDQLNDSVTALTHSDGEFKTLNVFVQQDNDIKRFDDMVRDHLARGYEIIGNIIVNNVSTTSATKRDMYAFVGKRQQKAVSPDGVVKAAASIIPHPNTYDRETFLNAVKRGASANELMNIGNQVALNRVRSMKKAN